MQIPQVIYKNESVPLAFTLESSPDSCKFIAVYDESDSGSPVNLPLTLNPTSGNWEASLVIPPENPIGLYTYQLWSTTGTTKKLETQGTFTCYASFETLGEGIPTKTLNEQLLEDVEASIRAIIKDGLDGFTVSGNQSIRTKLPQLKKERYYLRDLVNAERAQRGLPYLPGTAPVELVFDKDQY